MKFFDFSNLRGDLFGGLTAGIVALPLALAFGEASGAGPIAGLYGAIIVGFFASLFGGTPAQVSGPTGPMVVVFAGLFASLSGKPELVFAAVVLAGLLQILFGFLKVGEYIKLVPYPVISGFMTGIGIIIIALQLSQMFGYAPEEGGPIGALKTLPHAFHDPNMQAFGLGMLTLLMVFFWPKKLGKFLPGPLAALVVGTLAALQLNVPVLGDIPTGLPDMVIPSFSSETLLLVVEAAFILALLGAIDSLLTSLVADNMTRSLHNSNKELVGQGIGNAVAGLFGGVPGAGATMRTVINIRTGGKTKISGMTHALLLLAVALVLAPYAAHIPKAVLAGILIKVGWDIIDFRYLSKAHKGPRWDLALMVIVLGLTVFVDLITAVIVGVVMAALAFVHRIAKDQLDSFAKGANLDLTKAEQDVLDKAGGKIEVFTFSGPLSFGAAADITHKARQRAKEITSVIVLDFKSMPYIDVSAAIALENIITDARYSGRDVYTSGMNDQIRKTLKAFGALQHLGKDADFEKRIDALKAAQEHLKL